MLSSKDPTRGPSPQAPQPKVFRPPKTGFVLLKLKKRPASSFFADHRYATLAALAVTLTILGKAGGATFGNAVVISLWITSIVWVVWQVIVYFSGTPPEPPPKPVKSTVLAPHGIAPQKPNPKQPGNRR